MVNFMLDSAIPRYIVSITELFNLAAFKHDDARLLS